MTRTPIQQARYERLQNKVSEEYSLAPEFIIAGVVCLFASLSLLIALPNDFPVIGAMMILLFGFIMGGISVVAVGYEFLIWVSRRWIKS